jgi:hypothetical protein
VASHQFSTVSNTTRGGVDRFRCTPIMRDRGAGFAASAATKRLRPIERGCQVNAERAGAESPSSTFAVGIRAARLACTKSTKCGDAL